MTENERNSVPGDAGRPLRMNLEPTEQEVRTRAEILHANECVEGCTIGISRSWREYAKTSLRAERGLL